MTAYWAWSSHSPRIHAWALTRDQVRAAKRDRTVQTALCGWSGGIGERPTVRPFAEPEDNHCPECWRKLHPKRAGLWEPSFVTVSPFY